MKKRAVRKCNHDLVFVDKFTRRTGGPAPSNGKTKYVDVYRFICKKPNCLTVVDVIPNQ